MVKVKLAIRTNTIKNTSARLAFSFVFSYFWLWRECFVANSFWE